MGRNIFWGAALLLVGLLLLASNLGYIPPFNVWGLWPILIIVPALKFITGRTFITVGHHGPTKIPLGRSLGARIIALWVLAGAGAQLLFNLELINYDWGYVSYWTLPLLLVGIGVAVIARPKRWTWEWTKNGPKGESFEHVRRKKRHTHRNAYEMDETGEFSSFVGDMRFGARPWVFKSPMNLKLWAGDIDMDLTTATFEPGDNFLAVKSWAGDLDISVPRDIDVFVEARCAGGNVRVFDQHREGMSLEVRAHRQARAWGAEDREVVTDDGAADGVTDDATGASTGAEADAPAGTATERTRLFIAIDINFGNVNVR